MRLELIALRGATGHFSPPYGLLVIAGLTPKNIEVSITDENVEEIDFDKEVDLVGITVTTHQAPRAYKIADTFRKKGRTVILGGFHPSILPEEAAQHADAVVIREAEGLWTTVLNDFKAGKLKKFYQSKEWSDLENQPIPRKDLIKRDMYLLPDVVETSRGCPFRCKFCAVSAHFGSTYRFRPIKDVIEEVKTTKRRRLFFVDDNIVAIPRRAKELFRALTPLDKRWLADASINMAYDEELLRLAAQSGCIGVYIGFESVSPASIKEMGKSCNTVDRYKEAINKIHDHGICIFGDFIFGFDHEDTSIFEKTVKFIDEAKIDVVGFQKLIPYPGTPLYRKLKEEGRIITKDWSKYGGGNIVFQPKLMSVEELDEGARWAWKECYTYKAIFNRLEYVDTNRNWLMSLVVNFAYRQKQAVKKTSRYFSLNSLKLLNLYEHFIS